MKFICLGGAGKICREAAQDLIRSPELERLTIADVNLEEARRVAAWLDDRRVDVASVNVNEISRAASILREYDVVVDGTPISSNKNSTACISAAAVHGVNLNGTGPEWEFDRYFDDADKTLVAGFGMTPGVTNLMAQAAADQLDSVDEVRISHGAFRPIAFSPAIAETTRYEYDPQLDSRVVYEDGQFVQVPPFARPLSVELPAPFGTHVQYIIPHAEAQTLARTLADKGVRRIEVRGTWPPKNMRLLKALHEWGILTNPEVQIDGHTTGVLDTITAHLLASEEGQHTELYGYALHVVVTGQRDGQRVEHTYTHTHPASDGSIPEWEGLLAYTRCVGIPLGLAALLLARGEAKASGVLAPEEAFDPNTLFDLLAERDIFVHHRMRVDDFEETAASREVCEIGLQK